MDDEPGDVLADVPTIDELADYSRISRSTLSTLHKLAQEGRIPSRKVGRHGRCRKQAIDHRPGHDNADDATAEEEDT